MTAIQSTAKGGGKASAQAPPGAAPHAYVENSDGYSFRAPRYGDLVACPYCAPDFRPLRCDHCGDEGVLFASEVFQ